jgi:hypothetical protein
MTVVNKPKAPQPVQKPVGKVISGQGGGSVRPSKGGRG